MTIRTVAAAMLTLAAVTPSSAAAAASYAAAAAPGNDGAASHVVVDSYAGRSGYQRPVADHCTPRRHVVGWTSYSRRVVRRDYTGY